VIKCTLVDLVRLANIFYPTWREAVRASKGAKTDERTSFVPTTSSTHRRIDFCLIILLEMRPEPRCVCVFIKVHSTARSPWQKRKVDGKPRGTMAVAASTTMARQEREEERERERERERKIESEIGYNVHQLKIHHRRASADIETIGRWTRF